MALCPPWDYCGYEVEIDMVLAKKSGIYSKTSSQLDTIRQIRTAVGNFHRISDFQAHFNLSLESMVGSSQEIISRPTSSL